jgi:hypothetical protein
VPSPIKIRIGAALDASVDRVFQQIPQKSAQAQKAIQRQQRETTSVATAEAAKQLKAQERLAKASEALDRQRARGMFRVYQDQERAAERAARAQERSAARAAAAQRREMEKTWRALERSLAREQRAREAAERQAQRRSTRNGESFARRTSHRASRFMMPEAPLGPMALRGLGDVAMGAGLDFSVRGAVGRVVGLESLATDISNSGYQAGDARNGRRVDPNELIKQSRNIGGSLGMDAEEVLRGIDRFKNITGDLATSRSLIGDLAKLARATGTNLDDMAAAAANVSNGLGDVPDKARIIDEVMRTVAGQGKLGAVEISDMATHMARVAAAASAFAGDRADIIGKMGALTQEARATGGAPSAAEAARSVVGFSNTMKKTARINAFSKEGIDVFTDKTKTKLKDPIELIKESLLATGGDLQAMNKLFMDVIGARAVFGLQQRFIGAGGGDNGIKAVDARIQELIKAQVSQKEIEESSARAGQTTAAKAAQFQNELDKVTEQVMADLVPALEEAGPAILKFAGVLGDVATWAVRNPAAAIGGAITMSIARAGIESAFRSGIERLIVGPNSSRASGVGKVASAVGGVGTIAALGVTTLMVASLYAEKMYDESAQEFEEGTSKIDAADRLTKDIQAAMAAGDMKGAAKLAEKQVKLREEAAQDISNSENFTGAEKFWDELARGADKTFVPGGEQQLKSSDEDVLALMRDQIQAAQNSKALLAEIRDAIQQQQPPGGDAPPGGRVSN